MTKIIVQSNRFGLCTSLGSGTRQVASIIIDLMIYKAIHL